MSTHIYSCCCSGISRDVETLMVSPDLKIYVIPEDDGEATLYKIENGRAMEMCQISLESEYEAPTSGDIASCGTKVLLKAIDYMYFYYVPDGNYEAALCDPNPKVHRLQYTSERNGQVVAFKPGGLSYYTCTEEEFSPLWRYDLLKVNEVWFLQRMFENVIRPLNCKLSAFGVNFFQRINNMFLIDGFSLSWYWAGDIKYSWKY